MQSSNLVLQKAIFKEKCLRFIEFEFQSRIKVFIGPVWDIALKKLSQHQGGQRKEIQVQVLFPGLFQMKLLTKKIKK